MDPSIKKHNPSFFIKAFPTLLLSVLFLFGAILIGRVLNWGDIPFNVLDWSQEGPRYLFLKNVLQQGKWPLFIDSPMIETDRFLGIPDTLLVPQILLLHIVSLGQFILINTLFNYALGFYFLLRLKRQLSWSLTTILIVAPLVMLNGFILSHLAVGHSMWVNAFLIPWLIELCLCFPQEKIKWHWILNLSLFSLTLCLQGGFHFVLWSWGFIFIYALTKKLSIKTGVLAILISALASMIRILPASVTYYTSDRLFIAGFRTLDDLVRSLIQLQLPEQSQALMNSGLPNWETNFYIGLLSSLFLLIFGIILPILCKDPRNRFVRFWIPIFVMTILSLGQIFRFTNFLPLPFAHTERVSSRFFYIPFLFLIMIAGSTFNSWWEKFRQWSHKWLVICGIMLIILHDLAQNARFWRVDRLQTLFEIVDVPVIGDILTKTDPPYTTSILVGAAITLSTIIVLLILTLKNQTNNNTSKDSDPSNQD